MPIETVPGTDLNYYLIAFDHAGNERTDERDGLISENILEALSSEPITDVFLISHGWLSDVVAARQQYNDWIRAMYIAKNQSNTPRLEALRSDFHPLIIGLHWPSKPWGNENLDDRSFALDIPENSQLNNNLIEQYAQVVSDTVLTREVLRKIFAFADETNNNLPESLPPDILEAYDTLIQEALISNQNDDTDTWIKNEFFNLNPKMIYQASLKKEQRTNQTEETNGNSFGMDSDFIASVQDIFLQVPRLLSFWKMKDLARQIGQTSGFDLLKKLQNKTNADVRFHLIGHSFGTIVVSATIAGRKNNNKLVRKVNSLTLIQGAVSLWAYCKTVPNRKNLAGYFYSIIEKEKVAGPIVVTTSQYDTAVRQAYPIASRVGALGGLDNDLAIIDGKFPDFGGIGTYGIQGKGLDITNWEMRTVGKSYDFQPGKIYNLISDKFIQDGKKDAHTAIAKPEVAHAVWSAACIG